MALQRRQNLVADRSRWEPGRRALRLPEPPFLDFSCQPIGCQCAQMFAASTDAEALRMTAIIELNEGDFDASWRLRNTDGQDAQKQPETSRPDLIDAITGNFEIFEIRVRFSQISDHLSPADLTGS